MRANHSLLKLYSEKIYEIFINCKPQYLLIFLINFFFVNAQNSILDFGELWQGKFEPERLEMIRSMNDGEHYTVIEREKNSTKIVSYSYEKAKEKNIIFDSNQFSEILEISDYTFSKDENKVLLETNKDQIYRRSKQAFYWVYNLKTKKLDKVFKEKIQEPLLSPDGVKVAFVFKRNLFVKNLNTQKISQITFDGDYQTINGITDWVYEEEFGFVRAFDWSKDSNHIAYMRFDESKVPLFSMDVYGKETYPFPYMFRYPKAGEENSTITLYTFNLQSGSKEMIYFQDEPYYIPRIKFEGGEKSLIIQTLNRHQNDLKLWRWDIEKKEFQLLLREQDKAYVSIDDDFIFLEDNSFLWTSERDGYKHIYHYDKNGKLLKQLTNGNWEVTSLYTFNPNTKEVYYQSVEGSSIERGIYAIKLSGEGKRKLQPSKGTNGATFSKQGTYYIHSYSDEKTPPLYSLYKTKNNKIVRDLLENSQLLNTLKPFNFSNKEFSKIEINGNELNAWIIKPRNFNPKKKYPLLMFQYSGPGSQQVANRWGDPRTLWHKYLANQGYIIACVDGIGTGYKGAKFKKSTYLNLVKLEALDQIDVAKYFGSLPYIDDKRIGIWGWSFGGHMAAHCLLTGKEIFSLAIAVAPVTNWRFYDTIYTERFLRTPQENPEGYDLNSPLNYADQLEGKFLIIHGSGDDNVHVQNTMRMVEELIQSDKQFEWMIYPDKNHGIYGGNTRKHLYKKMTKFILQNL